MNLRSFLSVIASAAVMAAVPAFGTINILTVFEIRTTGSDTNAGGFLPGASGTDWSQQDAAQYSVTDGVTNGTTTVTSATANFGTDVVGNCIYINGGTGAVSGTNIRQIVSRTNATTIVVDSATGLTAGTGVTLKIGGAMATPARWIESTVTIGPFGCDAYIKAGTYTIGSGAVNTAGNKIKPTGSGTDPVILEGYQTTRGDLGTKPLLMASGTTGSLYDSGGNVWLVNVEINGNSTVSTGRASATNDRTVACKFSNCTAGYTASNVSEGFNNYATACATGFNIAGVEYNSVANACTVAGFTGATSMYVNCIDSGSVQGFTPGANSKLINCVAYGGTSNGFLAVATCNFVNCVAYGRGAKGFSVNFGAVYMHNCAAGGNTGVNEDFPTNGTARKYGFVTLSANPFVNAAAGNFALNATAGGGAALRALGYPATFPNGTTTQQMNIGAAQNSATQTVVGTNSVFLQ